jgi:hypothetical protein
MAPVMGGKTPMGMYGFRLDMGQPPMGDRTGTCRLLAEAIGMFIPEER